MPPTYTTGGLALTKPATVDPALIADLNTNADRIDAGTARVANVKGAAYGAVGDGTADDRAAILAAEAALGVAGGTLFFPAGTYKLASTTTLLATTHVTFAGGAVLAPATGTTLTVNGSIAAPESRIFGGLGAVVLPRCPMIWARWFGATGDGTGDDGPAINRAIVAAQAAHNQTVVLGAGTFRLTTQVVVAGSGLGLVIVGLPVAAAAQQGSLPPPTAVNWAGGAVAAFAVTTGFVSFHNFAIYNTGTGTVGLSFAPNSHCEVGHVWFAGPGGSTPWSTAGIYSDAGINYSSIHHCNFEVSPGIRMFGVHTTLEIANCVFDAAGAGAAIDATNVAGDLISIHNCTFNSRATAAIFFDNSTGTTALGNLIMRDCEFDCGSGAFQSYIGKLKNIYNVTLEACEVSNFSDAANTASPIQLTTVSRFRYDRINLSHMNKPLIKCNDTTCRVFPGVVTVDLVTTAGLVDATGAVPGNIVNLDSSTGPVAGKVRLHGELVDGSNPAYFEVTVPNNTAFQLQIPGPTDGIDPGWMAVGQTFTVRIRNASGGVMGAVTFDAVFKIAGAFTVPASGFNRSITFKWNGSAAHEIVRGAADVSN